MVGVGQFLQEPYSWLFGIILAITGLIIVSMFTWILEEFIFTPAREYFRKLTTERKISSPTATYEIIEPKAPVEKFYVNAFEQQEGKSHLITDIAEVERTHTYLTERCRSVSDDIPAGWEQLSLEMVEQKIFGVNLESYTRPDNPEYDSDVNGGSNDLGVDSYIIQSTPTGLNYGITLIQSKWHNLNRTNRLYTHDQHDVLDKLNGAATYIHAEAQGISTNSQLSSGETRFLRPLCYAWKRMLENYYKEVSDITYVPPPRISLVLVHHRAPNTQGNRTSFGEKKKLYKANTIDANRAYQILNSTPGVQIMSDRAPKHIRFEERELTSNLLLSEEEMDVYVGAISGLALCELYRSLEFGDAIKRDFGVLQMNVRRRLEWESSLENPLRDYRDTTDVAESINTSMAETIRDEKHRFVAYNNGITLVCSEFKKYGTYRRIRTPQIVNGGQTTEVLFELFRNAGGIESEDYIALKQLKVPIKVIDLKGKVGIEFETTAANIARRVNHQNPTDARALYSNDPRFGQLKSFWDSKTVKVFLGVKENEWKFLEKISEQGGEAQRSITDYMDSSGIKRKMEIDTDFGLLRWALLGAGALAAANKKRIWSNRLSIFHVKDSSPSYSELNESETLLATEPFCLLGTDQDLFDEALFAKIIYEELMTLRTKASTKKKKGFDEISDESERALRKMTLGAIAYPYFTLLAVNEVLRIRCENLHLTHTLEEKRKILVSYILGENRDSAGARANKWPFITRQSRDISKKWSSMKYRENTSLSYMRTFTIEKEMTEKNAIYAIIELTTKNISELIYSYGPDFAPAWRNNRQESKKLLNDLIEKVSSGSDHKRLMSIPFGNELVSKQTNAFDTTLTTILTMLDL